MRFGYHTRSDVDRKSTDRIALPFFNYWSIGLAFALLNLIWISCNQPKGPSAVQIFESNIISTENVEYALSFSPSGNELYFARSEGQWGTGNLKSSIYYSFKKDQKWSAPELASFSGEYDDSAPHITHDGRTLYFISNRPSPGEDSGSQDIWKVERSDGENWGKPIRLDNPISSSNNEYGISTDGQGNLYFASDRKGGLGQGDLYVAKKKNNGFESPENLGETINSATGEWNLEVSKDGQILIFEASQRQQNRSSFGDLYISFKKGGKWSVPQNIEEVNTTGSDLYPELVETENKLFFSSSDSLRSTRTNIYSIDFGFIEKKYRKSANFLTR